MTARKASKSLSVDAAIEKAQQGRVALPPGKAIEMAGKLYSSQKFGQAAKVCQQVIRARPGMADAHNILGVTLNAIGRWEEGLAAIQRAITLAPQASSFHANLGEVLRQRGKLEEASQALKTAIGLDPRNSQAHNNLGIVHYEMGEFEHAVTAYRKALGIRRDMPEAYNNLGNALRRLGDTEGATEAYQNALTYRENYAEAYNNLGTLLRDEKRFTEAEQALQKAITLAPRYVEAHSNLAAVYSQQERSVDALRVLGDALKIDGKHVPTLVLTARIQLTRGSAELAEKAARLVLAIDRDNTDATTILGQSLHELDRHEAAIKVLRHAVERSPEAAEVRNAYGIALKATGQLDEARTQILEAIKLNPEVYGAYANLNDLVDFRQEDELFEMLKAIAEDADTIEERQRLPVYFAYAKALDDRGDKARALEFYAKGAKLKRAKLNYSEEETFGFFDAIRAAFPKGCFDARSYAGDPDDRPVFIVGMPRSGSTLVEQILSSHSAVQGLGEVKYLSKSLGRLKDQFPHLPRYPAILEKLSGAQLDLIARHYQSQIKFDPAALRVTDKLLTNYYFVGLIHTLFPNAKIIHTKRNPVDTCLSAYTKLFKDDMPHSYDLGELGRYYKKYDELMSHWADVLPAGVMTTIHYEDMVAQTEEHAKKLIEFIALDWEPACLDFHKSERPVKTASVAQVRKPIYDTAVLRHESMATASRNCWTRSATIFQAASRRPGREGSVAPDTNRRKGRTAATPLSASPNYVVAC